MPSLLCIGEVLWDVFPKARHLGGAPFNVACHLKALGRDVAFASRVGRDALGEEILAAVESHEISTQLIQVDAKLPTGVVNVTFPAPESPAYDIVRPSAWDAIEPAAALLDAASAADLLVFGTLAQREERSRQTIHEAIGRCPGTVVCDVNLRPPYDDAGVVESSLRRATVAKLNDDEVLKLAEWFTLPEDQRKAASALAHRFDLRTVCVTRGASGAALWHEGRWYEHPGYRVKVADAVGAGDAFLASLLSDLVGGLSDPAASLARANATGAYVASQPSATPPLDLRRIEEMRQGR
jgi:fructokinase